MTYMKDTEVGMSGLSVVLRPADPSVAPTPLAYWLSEVEHPPIWVPLLQSAGVTKVMPVLSKPQLYPALMQSICKQIAQNTAVEWQGKPYDLTGVEVDPHALHVIQIPISTAEPLPPTMGRAIHAQCFRWLASADAAVAEQLHQQDNLPITLALKSSASRHVHLRIALLKRELLAPLLWGLSEDLGGEISLAGIACRMGKWVEILQASSFEKLTQVSPKKVVELQFLSPTSFKQGKDIQPFPLPELVFSSLLRRWNTFAPEHLHFSAIEWKGLSSAYELKTYALKMEAGAEIGAQGWVRYRFSDAEQARVATILAHFALFAGVGRKTAMGMGQARLLAESQRRD